MCCHFEQRVQKYNYFDICRVCMVLINKYLKREIYYSNLMQGECVFINCQTGSTRLHILIFHFFIISWLSKA